MQLRQATLKKYTKLSQNSTITFLSKFVCSLVHYAGQSKRTGQSSKDTWSEVLNVKQ